MFSCSFFFFFCISKVRHNIVYSLYSLSSLSHLLLMLNHTINLDSKFIHVTPLNSCKSHQQFPNLQIHTLPLLLKWLGFFAVSDPGDHSVFLEIPYSLSLLLYSCFFSLLSKTLLHCCPKMLFCKVFAFSLLIEPLHPDDLIHHSDPFYIITFVSAVQTFPPNACVL